MRVSGEIAQEVEEDPVLPVLKRMEYQIRQIKNELDLTEDEYSTLDSMELVIGSMMNLRMLRLETD